MKNPMARVITSRMIDIAAAAGKLWLVNANA